MKINVRPIGRYANVIFQCAAAIGYTQKHGGHWGIQSNLREVPRFLEYFPNVLVINGDFKRYNRTDPSQFNYEELPKFNQDTTLLGFFQSIKYFEHCQDEVKRVFKLDIKPVDAVSIHVRRTDYVQYANSFPPINGNYITQALRMTCNTNRSEKIIVFSDDVKWCKENIPEFIIDTGVNFPDEWGVEYSEGRNEFEDLSLMASCSHHIIANSTFSWMGAFLGHNPDKIVVSPHYENWFGPGFTGSAPKDLIPESWHQIKFR